VRSAGQPQSRLASQSGRRRLVCRRKETKERAPGSVHLSRLVSRPSCWSRPDVRRTQWTARCHRGSDRLSNTNCTATPSPH